jgi:HPt (histidine-containing phosphotransfer) domain-containing protein
MGVIDLNYLRSICDNDQRFMKEMIITFLEMTPILIAQMHLLTKENKWNELGKAAHQLKPSLQFMGMEPARHKVKEIEESCRFNTGKTSIEHLLYAIEKDCKQAFKELNCIIKKDFVSIRNI